MRLEAPECVGTSLTLCWEQWPGHVADLDWDRRTRQQTVWGRWSRSRGKSKSRIKSKSRSRIRDKIMNSDKGKSRKTNMSRSRGKFISVYPC